MAYHSRSGDLDEGPKLIPERRKRGAVAYDPTINLGHVISLGAFLISGGIAYFDLRERVAINEQHVRTLEVETVAEKGRIRDSLSELKSDMREVRRGMDKLVVPVSAVHPK